MKLVEVIDKVRKYQGDILGILNRLKEESLVLVKECLIDLLHVGMYMRSWSGPPEPYVLKFKKLDDQDVIDDRVYHSIETLQRQCDNLVDKEVIFDLPLFLYDFKKNGQYKRSSNSKEGLTVGKRLAIMRRGNLNKMEVSCVRSTSNWILSTVAYFALKINIKIDLNIDEVEEFA